MTGRSHQCSGGCESTPCGMTIRTQARPCGPKGATTMAGMEKLRAGDDDGKMAMAMMPAVGSPLRLAPLTNVERMYALDEAWNARDWDTFDAYHDQSDVVVYWPERRATPTMGGRNHRAEAERFCRAFPDNKVHHPYQVLFGDADFTSFVTRFTGSFTGPL